MSDNEKEFKEWYKKWAKKTGINLNPDDPKHFYDYRAAFRAGVEPDEKGHWPSKFKKVGHPTYYTKNKSSNMPNLLDIIKKSKPRDILERAKKSLASRFNFVDKTQTSQLQPKPFTGITEEPKMSFAQTTKPYFKPKEEFKGVRKTITRGISKVGKGAGPAALSHFFFDLPQTFYTVLKAGSEVITEKGVKMSNRLFYGPFLYKKLEESNPPIYEESKKIQQNILEQINKPITEFSKKAIDSFSVGQQMVAKMIQDEKPGLSSIKEYSAAITSGAISMGEAIAITLISGNTNIAAAFLSSMEATSEYNNARQSGLPPTESLKVASASGFGTFLLEKIGLDYLFSLTGGNRIFNAFKSMVFETLQEETQTVWQNLVRKYSYKESQEIFEGWWETAVAIGPASFVAGLIVPGLVIESPQDLVQDIKNKAGVSQETAERTTDEMVEETEKARKEFEKQLSPEYLAGVRYKAAESPEAKRDEITTTILEDLKDKTLVSKQYIEDLTRMKDLKKVEIDLIKEVLAEYPEGKIPVKEFSNKVRQALLPLAETLTSDFKFPTKKWEGYVLPKAQRGSVAEYQEIVYESPIKVSAGDIHWGRDFPGYFAHVRAEDMSRIREIVPEDIPTTARVKGAYPSTTRRLIELQSDLFQRGRLARELETGDTLNDKELGYLNDNLDKSADFFIREFNLHPGFFPRLRKWAEVTNANIVTGTRLIKQNRAFANKIQEIVDILEKQGVPREKEIARLEPYRNTWHERIIREEIKRAATDGKKILRFPTGETAMMVEGLGEADAWTFADRTQPLTVQRLRVGMTVNRGPTIGEGWTITKVLEDGKFRAVPVGVRDLILEKIRIMRKEVGEDIGEPITEESIETQRESYEEEFDISGEIDKTNPIYKFYEKDVQKFLKRVRPDTKRITDEQGVTWFETAITNRDEINPVYAFKEGVDSRELFNVSPERANELLQRFFDESEVKFATAERMKFAKFGKGLIPIWGRYYNSLIEVVERDGKVSDRTLYHEAFHAYMDLFVDETERFEVLKLARQRSGVDTLQKAEEYLADSFAEYVAQPKSLPEKIVTFFMKIINKVASWVGKENQIFRLFEDIIAKKRPITAKERIEAVPKFKAAEVPDEVSRAKDRIEEIRNEIIGMTPGTPEHDALLKEAEKLQEDISDAKLAEKEEEIILKEPTEVPDYIKKQVALVKESKEYKTLSEDLKKEVTIFRRPSRQRASRAFSMLGNKNATIPLFSEIFDQWVKGGVDTIIEPYGGAFTLGTHSLKKAIKSGLKEFHSNVYDIKKYTLVKAIQDGKINQVKQAVDKAVKVINNTILRHSLKEPKVNDVFKRFFQQYPESYIGSNQWFDYARELTIGKQVEMKSVFGKEYEMFRKVFQGMFNELYDTKVVDIDSAVLAAIIRRIGKYGDKGQSLVGANGFKAFENVIYDKYGMVQGFEDMAESFRLARENKVKMVIYNEDGVKFIDRFKGYSPDKVGNYMDPPYVHEAMRVYGKQITAGGKIALEKFTSGDKFVDSHINAVDMQRKGVKTAINNDVDEPYIRVMTERMDNTKTFLYKELQTPTSLITDFETANIVDTYLAKAEKEAFTGREEISTIREIQADKGLSNKMISSIRKAFGAREWKNTTPKQFANIIEFMETLEDGDTLLTDLEREGSKKLIRDYGEFNKPLELVTLREFRERFGQHKDIMQGRIGRLVSPTLIPTVDLKDMHPLIKRTVNGIDAELRDAQRRIKERDKKINDFVTKAEQSEKGLPIIGRMKVWTKIFQAASGVKGIELTKEQTAALAYFKNFFEKVKKEPGYLNRYRRHYIPHIEAKFWEKVYRFGLIRAFKESIAPKTTDIPLDLWTNLPYIIGSKKFFRFALERKGGITPTMDLRRIVGEYSRVYEMKKALDNVLPEAQLVTKRLLLKKSARWQTQYLQNLKGRGLDSQYRDSEWGPLMKVGDRIIDIAYFQYLPFNVWANFKNIVAGEALSYMEQGAKKWLTGKARLVRHPVASSKFISDSGVLDGSYVEMARSDVVNRGKLLSNILYGGMKIGEYEIRGTLLLGELTDQEWSDVLKGKKPIETLPPKRFREILDKIGWTQTLFTKVDAPLFDQTMPGRMIKQFRRWMTTDIMYVRRVTKAALEDFKAKKFGSPNMWRLFRMVYITGLFMFISWDLGKRGYKKAEKVARAGAELLYNIFNMFPPKFIYDSVVENASIQNLAKFVYSYEQLMYYIGVGDEPRKIEFRGGIEDLYFNLLRMLGVQKKKGAVSKPSLMDIETPKISIPTLDMSKIKIGF